MSRRKAEPEEATADVIRRLRAKGQALGLINGKKKDPSRFRNKGSGAGGKHKKPWPVSIPPAALSRAAGLHCRGPGVVAYPSGVALLL